MVGSKQTELLNTEKTNRLTCRTHSVADEAGAAVMSLSQQNEGCFSLGTH